MDKVSFSYISSEIFLNKNLKIKKTFDEGKHFLISTFTGKLTELSSEEGCYALVGIKESDPTISYIHIWDCEKMTGFEQKAKKRWISTMNEMQFQIEEVWVVSDNIIIRGAVRLMSKFSKHVLRTFKNMDEVDRWFEQQNSIDTEY